MYTKPYILFDKTKKSLKISSILKKKIKTSSLNKADFFIVIGGDGYMLKILKKFHIYKKPFYGINSGSYGFLMNKFSKKNFLNKIKKNHPISIKPLNMIVKKKK
jgi:Predicted sugar kinase